VYVASKRQVSHTWYLQVSAATSRQKVLSTELRQLKDEALVLGYKDFTPQQLDDGIKDGKNVPWLKNNSRPDNNSNEAQDEPSTDTSQVSTCYVLSLVW
jgi:hypothetical protein